MNALILLFYRIVTFFTRVPAKTRVSHTLLRASELSEIDALNSYYINRQESFKNIPYAAGTLAEYGCGPIALYNAITAIDGHGCFSSITDYLEHKGTAFGGRLGTSPYAIKSFLKKHGYKTRSYRRKSVAGLNSFSQEFEAFISLIYNDSGSIKSGLHFICTKKTSPSVFTTHNPEKTAATLYDALNLCSYSEIRHVYTIGIRK